jgi:hypothetical protein
MPLILVAQQIDLFLSSGEFLLQIEWDSLHSHYVILMRLHRDTTPGEFLSRFRGSIFEVRQGCSVTGGVPYFSLLSSLHQPCVIEGGAIQVSDFGVAAYHSLELLRMMP